MMIVPLYLLFIIEILYIPIIFANDCVYFGNAVKYFGTQYEKPFLQTSNCCDLSAITCDSEQNITEIHLSNINDVLDNATNGIEEFQNLKNLTLLELNGVKIGSSIPQVIFKLNSLETLIISNCHISLWESQLENEFDKLPNLEKLDLSDNHFIGKIPNSICNLKKLKYLDLKYNDLEGAIPYDCKNLKELVSLNVEGNRRLEGYVPLLPELANCDYTLSELCYLPEASCKPKLTKKCTKDQIKSTNAINGNPNPGSDDYAKISFFNSFIHSTTFKVIIIILIVVIILAILNRLNEHDSKRHKVTVIKEELVLRRYLNVK